MQSVNFLLTATVGIKKVLVGFQTFPICGNISSPQYNYASDIYEKMEDYKALAALYVETQQWERVGTVNIAKYM